MNDKLTFHNFLKTINIEENVCRYCIDYIDTISENFINNVFLRTSFEEAPYDEIEKEINDTNGLKLLSIQLFKCYLLHDKYIELEINDKIYFDTMKCFSRFMQETFLYTKKLSFDRYFWTWRQAKMLLFRIGELEYEIIENNKVISIHIPSDVDLNDIKVEDSINEARNFFATKFSYTKDYDFIIYSWIVNDSLLDLLPRSSNILKFKERFSSIKFNPHDESFLQRVFKTSNKKISELKEETTLQKNIKNYLLKGNEFGATLAKLNNRTD